MSGKKITEIVYGLQRGEVTTYGFISIYVYGHKQGGRSVGRAIKDEAERRPDDFPWWRVVYTGWEPRRPYQRNRLGNDGVKFTPEGTVISTYRVRCLCEISN